MCFNGLLVQAHRIAWELWHNALIPKEALDSARRPANPESLIDRHPQHNVSQGHVKHPKPARPRNRCHHCLLPSASLQHRLPQKHADMPLGAQEREAYSDPSYIAKKEGGVAWRPRQLFAMCMSLHRESHNSTLSVMR
jgi:hypothetical protein